MHLRHRYPYPQDSPSLSSSAAAAVEQARKKLEENTAGLVFDAPSHTYTLEGRVLHSVSSVVGRFAPFDADKVAEGCSRNPRGKYYGMEPEAIKQIWAENAAHGTQVHAFAEACCLWCQGRGDLIDPEYRARITPDGLLSCSPHETAAVLWWDSLDLSRYAVVAKETMVVNRLLGYAGTFDLLLYDTLTGRFCIRDYKTNADLLSKGSGRLKAPLTNIANCEVGRYTVQQTLYMIVLEMLGIPVGSMSLVWLREGSVEEVALDCVYASQIFRAVEQLRLIA